MTALEVGSELKKTLHRVEATLTVVGGSLVVGALAWLLSRSGDSQAVGIPAVLANGDSGNLPASAPADTGVVEAIQSVGTYLTSTPQRPNPQPTLDRQRIGTGSGRDRENKPVLDRSSATATPEVNLHLSPIKLVDADVVRVGYRPIEQLSFGFFQDVTRGVGSGQAGGLGLLTLVHSEETEPGIVDAWVARNLPNGKNVGLVVRFAYLLPGDNWEGTWMPVTDSNSSKMPDLVSGCNAGMRVFAITARKSGEFPANFKKVIKKTEVVDKEFLAALDAYMIKATKSDLLSVGLDGFVDVRDKLLVNEFDMRPDHYCAARGH